MSNRTESVHTQDAKTTPADARPDIKTDLLNAAGYVIGLSYPVLALSTGVRATYQFFFREDITYYLPVALSGVAALCYLLATIGFLYRRRWSWYFSVSMLGIETCLTLLVGGLSIVTPEFIGRTVWRHFGADYGYFPLFQPLIGLAWLLWPKTRRLYGVLIAGPGERTET